MDDLFAFGWPTDGVARFIVLALVLIWYVRRTDKIIDRAWGSFYNEVLESYDETDKRLSSLVFIAKAARAGFTLISELLVVIALALCVIAYNSF
jgi:steroid 5-alpha reductase family enzyme